VASGPCLTWARRGNRSKKKTTFFYTNSFCRNVHQVGGRISSSACVKKKSIFWPVEAIMCVFLPIFLWIFFCRRIEIMVREWIKRWQVLNSVQDLRTTNRSNRWVENGHILREIEQNHDFWRQKGDFQWEFS